MNSYQFTNQMHPRKKRPNVQSRWRGTLISIYALSWIVAFTFALLRENHLFFLCRGDEKKERKVRFLPNPKEKEHATGDAK